MTQPKDYEVYFNTIGITDEIERNTILVFVRELFAIAQQHYNNETEIVEAWV